MINDWDTLFPDIHNGSYNTEMCCYKIHPVEKNQQANLSSIQMYRISTLHIHPQLKKKIILQLYSKTAWLCKFTNHKASDVVGSIDKTNSDKKF